MKNLADLKQKVLDANKAYRAGEDSGYTDFQYDEMVDELAAALPRDEYEKFRNSLNEGSAGGKIRFDKVMGSLDKIKNSDAAALSKFVKSYVRTSASVSAKVDGISCRLLYRNGRLVNAATRGDGYVGQDLTDKIKYVKGVPQSIDCSDELQVRGELVIFTEDLENSSTNRRNVCAGTMNRKEWSKDDVAKVSFVPYTVLGNEYTKKEQFDLLDRLGFSTAWHTSMRPDELTPETLTGLARTEHAYECDGLVIMDESAYNEQDEYRPKNATAFKINEVSAETTIIDVVFEGPTKDGFHVPVAVFEPVELDGAMTSRATLHNMDFIAEKNLKYGSRVRILKAGDIIPQVADVLGAPPGAKDIDFPSECACCGAPLAKDGVNLRCRNPDCIDQKVYKTEKFIKKLGVMNASFKTLKSFKIHSYEDLLSFVPDKKYKSQVKFEDELLTKLFTAEPEKMFCKMDIMDVGETLQTKIVEYYGWENVKAGRFENGLPEGIGEITLGKFKDAYRKNLSFVELATSDVRYSVKAVPKKEPKGSVCFTGSLSIPRSVASKMAEDAGYEVKSSVTKNLTYLVTPDPNSGSSKNVKAAKLGVKVIGEDEFKKLTTVQPAGASVMDL